MALRHGLPCRHWAGNRVSGSLIDALVTSGTRPSVARAQPYDRGRGVRVPSLAPRTCEENLRGMLEAWLSPPWRNCDQSDSLPAIDAYDTVDGRCVLHVPAAKLPRRRLAGQISE